MSITPEQAKEAIEFLDSVAARVAGNRESHDNVKRATKCALEFIAQDTALSEAKDVTP